MAKYLVIVESPAKAKTIHKFLGSNYTVAASNGHVRDLPKSQMGIDIDNDFEIKYITIRGKGDILAMLRKEVKKADKVYLATDPDREGEAIAWHLAQALKLEEKDIHRITFNEITKTAVKNSIKNARGIDMDLVDAQQARRVLDRIVGYSISPLLWTKVKRGLSAGRVQSVALRIICDREKEIESFIPTEYWTLEANLKVAGDSKPLCARFYGMDGKKVEILTRDVLETAAARVEGATFAVKEIRQSERSKKPPLPFTTSTLQQEASRQLNFSTQKTMRLAQQLYEGVDIIGAGTIGLITYLRTDSTRVSDEADLAARDYIREAYGAAYVGGQIKSPQEGRKIQDAHEAIRPTYMAMTPPRVRESLARDQFRLYQLIWNRFLASRMSDAVYETATVKIEANGCIFTAGANKVKFDGFMSVYRQEDDREEKGTLSKKLTTNSRLTLASLEKKQHYTQPPAHYTEASLVKALEELGIGRPSTYSPTITTIIARHYVARENKNLYVTELGEVVNQIMVSEFPSIVDVEFTANMEYLLDKVAEGKVNYKTIIRNFYPDLEVAVHKAEEKLEKVQIADEVSDVPCDQCGRMMVIKYGPHGKFLACPGFPECRNTKTYFEKIGVKCPKCGGDLVIKKTQKGRKFYGCMNFPECDFVTWQRPSGQKCPRCGGLLLYKGNRLVCMNGQCGYVAPLQKQPADVSN